MRASQWPCSKFRSSIRSKWICGALLARTALTFSAPVPDSLVTSEELGDPGEARTTSFSFAGGGGSYFRESLLTVGQTECGPMSVPITGKSDFKEVGAAVDHQASKRVHIGVRGGYVWTDNSVVGGYDTTITEFTAPNNYLHVDPYIAVEWKYFGVGVGGVFSGATLPEAGVKEVTDLNNDGGDAQLSGHIRVGSLSSVYANVSRWEGVPLLTNGHLTAGIGVRPIRPLELYAAHITEGPYQSDAWMGRITVDANPNWSFNLNMRLKEDWDGLGNEYGTSLGATYHIRH